MSARCRACDMKHPNHVPGCPYDSPHRESTMKGKITGLPTPVADELLAGLAEMRRNAKYLREYNEIDAGTRKAKYDSLVKAGFTEKQALELCK